MTVPYTFKEDEMKLKDLINELRDLGFEEDSTMQEYNEVTINAINRATWLIYDNVVTPLLGYYKRLYRETTKYYKEEEVYEDTDGTKKLKKSTYNILTIGDSKPVPTTTSETIETVEPSTATYKRTELVDEKIEEWYPVRPTVLTTSSENTVEIGLPDNVLRITALLTAHYLWLDDDETKAVYYYNEYETFANALIDSCRSNAKCTVITHGWGW